MDVRILIVIFFLILGALAFWIENQKTTKATKLLMAKRMETERKEKEMKDAVSKMVSEAGGCIDDSFGTEYAFLAIDRKRGRLTGMSDAPSIGRIDMDLSDIASVDLIDNCSEYAEALEMEHIHKDRVFTSKHSDYMQTYHPFAVMDGHKAYEGFIGKPVFGLVIHPKEGQWLHIAFSRGGDPNQPERFIQMKEFARRLDPKL